MNLITLVLALAAICTAVGYFIPSLEYFRTKRFVRVITYIFIFFLVIILTEVIFTVADTIHNVRGSLYQQQSGTIAGYISFWFYFGTVVRNVDYQKFGFKNLKKGFGILLIIGGVSSIVGFAFNGFNLPNESLFLGLFMGVSSLVFGYSLIRSSNMTVSRT